jgi:hypothetical protein
MVQLSRKLPTVLLVCLSLVSFQAAAQGMRGTGSLKLAPMERELGLNAGTFKIFPHLRFGYGYNSNVFNADDTAWETPIGAQFLQIAPGFDIASKNSKNVGIKLGAQANWDQYLSDNSKVEEQSNLGGKIDARAIFFQSSPVSLILQDSFRRALERRNYESTRNYNRNVNRVGGGLLFKPGGGALEMKAIYNFASDRFTDVDADWGDLLVHDVSVSGTWKFFPFTAFVLDANWQQRKYLADAQGRYGELTDNAPLRIRVGVNGFITKKLSLLLLLGYGNSFHDKHQVAANATTNPNENDSFNMPVGEARLSFKFSPNTILQGGYRYDFADSIFSNYTEYHRVNLNLLQRIAGRVDLEVDVAYMYRIYAQLPKAYFQEATDSAVKASLFDVLPGYDRTDMILLAKVKATVDITRFLAFEAVYEMELNNDPLQSRTAIFRSCLDDDCGEPGGTVDYVGYKRHVVFANLVLRY